MKDRGGKKGRNAGTNDERHADRTGHDKTDWAGQDKTTQDNAGRHAPP